MVGLAGGVGSGKSTAAAFFSNRGAHLVDADAIGHKMLDRPAVRASLVRVWGKGILRRGRINRPELAQVAFRTRESVEQLNQVVHPPLLKEIRRQLARIRGWAVLDAALLYEFGVDQLCDRVVFMWAPLAVRLERTASRGWPAGELKKRERFQESQTIKRKKAHYVVNNGGSKSRTERQLENISVDLGRLFARPSDSHL